MIAVFAYRHLGQEARRGNAALLQTRRQWSDHRGDLRRLARNELAPDNLMTEKFSWPVVEGLSDFLTDATEGLRVSHDFHRFNNFALNGKILRPTFASLLFSSPFGNGF